MTGTVVGIMHPGEMGASVASAARSTGYTVLWCHAGRSPRSKQRAQQADLQGVDTPEQLVTRSQVLLSVCPPHAARCVAQAVADAGFDGLYVDANAVAPGTAREVARIVCSAGATYVDGGIIGPPAWQPDSTRLYLSGVSAPQACELFQGSLLEPVVLEGDPFAASALKMSYAAWTKGSTALLANVQALARAAGVDQALEREWGLSQPGLAARAQGSVTGGALKAWRWIAEMNEIADSFETAGLPGGFHRAAAEIYERMRDFKDGQRPGLDEIQRALLAGQSSHD